MVMRVASSVIGPPDVGPELRMFAEQAQMRPLGDTGLQRWGGVLYEEPVSALSGQRWFRIVREMRLTSPIIAGMLFAIEMLIRRAEWVIDTPDEEDGTEAKDVADFVESCRYDMRTTWEDTLAQILSFLPYGFSLFEVVYKRRLGAEGDPLSNADDGLIGWDEWSPRSQETVVRWYFDDGGHAIGFEQQVPSTAKSVDIPLSRCLHFRSGGYKGSPEGESILRAAYIDWDAVGKIQLTEAIGIERDLAGLPVFRIPAELLDTDTTGARREAFNSFKKIGNNLRRGDQAVVILPSEVDPETKAPRYSLDLLSSGGQRQIDTSGVINRRTRQMTQSILADFMMLGQTATGSFALSEDKTTLFMTAISAWLDAIANIINDQAIKPLLRVNGIDAALTPILRPGPLDEVDLPAQAQYFTALWPAIQTLDRQDQINIMGYLADIADWPDITTEPEAAMAVLGAPPTGPTGPAAAAPTGPSGPTGPTGQTGVIA
jgi:hypothetical protein